MEFTKWLDETVRTQIPAVSHNLLGAVYRVKVDQGSRVVIPKDIRDEIEINEGDTIEYRVTRTGTMALSKVEPEPYWIQRTMRTADNLSKGIKLLECSKCHNLTSMNVGNECPHCGVKINKVGVVN